MSHGFSVLGTIVISVKRVAKSKIGTARFWVRGLAISPPKFFYFWERAFPLEFSEEKKTRGNSWAGPPTPGKVRHITLCQALSNHLKMLKCVKQDFSEICIFL